MKLAVLVPLFLIAVSAPAQPTTCMPAPAGLVGWWRGEGDASDWAGTNNGILINGSGFGPAEVGQGFSFTSPDQCVQVPDAPALDPTNSLSLEAWVLLSTYPNNDGVLVVHKNVFDVVPDQYNITVWQTGSNSIFQVTLGVVPGGDITLYSTTWLQTNTWYHVAMTYDTAALRLYVNGKLEASAPATGPIVTTSGPLEFSGYGFGPWSLPGQVDEVSLYNRALTGYEVEAIYAAGSFGKCYMPRITLQPQGQVGYWGRSVTFSVQATGAPPPAYQWYKDGLAISWATNSILVFTNLSLDAGGKYSVEVSNAFGSVASSNAFLIVNPAGVTLGLYAGLTIEGAAGNTYGIQYATNISPTTVWSTLTQITLTQPVQLWMDTNVDIATGASPRRFYRVVAVP